MMRRLAMAVGSAPPPGAAAPGPRDLPAGTGVQSEMSVPPTTAAKVRPEIQALRAIAVGLVLVYHFWPSALPGGFVGVDVFFVISGFLISTQLLREVERSGTVSMPRFWARRARRLLPASLVTLLACAIATVLFVPTIYASQYFTEIGASAAYFENWVLADSAVDYLRSDDLPSPVQHFWSLSVEEQFYLVWPLLIVAAVLGVRGRRGLHRRAIAIVLSLVTAGSLAYSIHATATDPAAAFFVTPTRAWEFGVGGLLALLPLARTSSAAVRSAISWAGLAAIVVAAVTYSASTPFPGWHALLPVLGALAVIHAGAPRTRWAPTPGLTLRPVQSLGDLSYSLYLWHWPFLVFAPFALDVAELADTTKVILLMLSILAAWLSKTLVEDPVRRSRSLARRRSRFTFAAAGIATVLVVAGSVGANARTQDVIDDARATTARTVASTPACFGARARDRVDPCSNPSLRLTVVPSPVEAADDANSACGDRQADGLVTWCRFGVPPAKAKRTIAVLGDSHASVMRAPLDVVAKRKGWAGISVTRTGCAYSAATKRLPGKTGGDCVTWNKQVPRWFRDHPEVDTVFVTAITGSTVAVPPGKTMAQAKVGGYLRAYKALPDTVKRIVVIRDVPKARGNTLRCINEAIAARQPAGTQCAVPRVRALVADPQVIAADRLQRDRVTAVDMSSSICDSSTCFAVVGGVLVNKDVHHLTRLFATTLGPVLLRDVNRISADWPPPS